jgi:hypothetical protein
MPTLAEGPPIRLECGCVLTPQLVDYGRGVEHVLDHYPACEADVGCENIERVRAFAVSQGLDVMLQD